MTVQQLAELLNGAAHGETAREIRGVASLEGAGPEDLAYAEGARAIESAAHSHAGCVLVSSDVTLAGQTAIAVVHPKLAFIGAAQVLCPAREIVPGIHPTALIASDAVLGEKVSVGPYVVIESGVAVGAGTCLGAGVFLGEGAQVGAECVLYPRVTIYPGARLGNRVILHAGVVVGGDGFGYVFAEGRHVKFPQLGQVIIEDDVEIGSNSTVDRGSLGTTVVGEGTKIDNLVQIAHNVRVGRHCVIAAQTGISGSVEIGDYVVMGGQVGIGDHARVEARAVLGGGAGILPGKIVREGETVWGRPARRLAQFKRLYAHFSSLPALAERVKDLSRQLRARGS
ncbi:MAG: UDP-3-O-(3-hydroxymyristoyl)glucosamine N-acyltransferase [Acidobacteriia bacterium]|nr:UDP-3-O-(3-hydroxymyristoyl)glucosamine N-acyltransferase [Terriglobia bacterium]